LIIKQNITGLNTLRFLCFLVIFINHATPYFHYGFLAVDFFFTLSGFLITLLAFNEIQLTGTVNRWNFFMRRILRIWPLYFVIISFSFFILPLIMRRYGLSITLPDKKIYYWLFISNYDYGDYHFAFKQLWTIAVEEQFYLLFILLSFFLKNHFWKIIFLLSIIWTSTIIYSQINSDINLYSNTLYHLISFLAGMIVAKIVFAKSYTKSAIMYVTIIVSFILTIWFINESALKQYMKIPFSIFAGSVILMICQQQNKIEKKKMFLKPTEQLGKYTYGLYIYSGFIISAGTQFLKWENKPLLYAAELICTIIIATLSYHFFEIPFLKLKEKFRR